MLMLKGTLINVFQTPKKTNKDGEEYGGQDKLQIMGDIVLENGETQKGLIDLTCHDANAFEGFQGVEIELPVSVMAPEKNKVVYYLPKGSVPKAANAA